MKSVLIFAVILSLSACKKAPEAEMYSSNLPIRGTIGDLKLVDYFPENESFRCYAPANWSIDESSLGEQAVAFRKGNTSIVIEKNPGGQGKDPEAWANVFAVFEKDNKAPVLEKSELNGRKIIQLSRNQPLMKLHSNQVNYVAKERHALIPIPGGFYDIRLSAHPDDYAAALPIFEAVVKSFKPKS